MATKVLPNEQGANEDIEGEVYISPLVDFLIFFSITLPLALLTVAVILP